MPDRLDELRRQREIVRQHLAWLDAEIDRANDPGTARAAAPSFHDAPPGSATASAEAADNLLARYQAEAGGDSRRVKLGCWVAFFAAFAGLALVIGGWYLLRSR